MSTALEKLPQLGSKPVVLSVRFPAPKSQGHLEEGLQDLYRKGELADVALSCSGQTFLAHRCVLAAQSPAFRAGFEVGASEASLPAGSAGSGSSGSASGPGRQEIRLAEVSNPEAVKFMLDYLYQTDAHVWEDYTPRTQDINKDVLRLAQDYQLPGLVDRATYWVSKDITTGNVVERLAICEDFDLSILRDKILEQLTMNKRALSEVANSPQIMAYPKLMQALLQQAAAMRNPPAVEAKDAQPKKKAKQG